LALLKLQALSNWISAISITGYDTKNQYES
jgi:hypothetical protein